MLNPELAQPFRVSQPDKHLISPQNLTSYRETQSLKPNPELINQDLKNLGDGLLKTLHLMLEIPTFALIATATGLGTAAVCAAIALHTDQVTALGAASWLNSHTNIDLVTLSLAIPGAALSSMAVLAFRDQLRQLRESFAKVQTR